MATTAGTPIPSGKTKEEPPASGNPTGTQDGTPPTHQPPAPPTSGQPVDTTGGAPTGAGVPKEEFDRLQKMLADERELRTALHRQNLELTRRVTSAPAPAPQPPANPEVESRAFWDNPVTTMRKLIAEEMDARVGVLNQRFQEALGDRRFEAVKAEYADIWSDIENEVKAAVQTSEAQGTEVNEGMVKFIAMATAGAYYRGQLPTKPKAAPIVSTPAPAPPAAPPAAPVSDPAFLRPSAPQIPRGGTAQPEPKREYTEVERRLMRERKMTEEEWDFFMNSSPTDFLTKDPPKKEGAK